MELPPLVATVTRLRRLETQGFYELNVLVDGVPVIRSSDSRWGGNPASVNDFVLPIEVGGVEVYSGAAALSAEFSGFDSRCGAVVIWTK